MSIQWGDSSGTDLLIKKGNSVLLFSLKTQFEFLDSAGSPTFFLHASPEALLQPAVSALISLVFVHDALSVEPGK